MMDPVYYVVKTLAVLSIYVSFAILQFIVSVLLTDVQLLHQHSILARSEGTTAFSFRPHTPK